MVTQSVCNIKIQLSIATVLKLCKIIIWESALWHINIRLGLRKDIERYKKTTTKYLAALCYS